MRHSPHTSRAAEARESPTGRKMVTPVTAEPWRTSEHALHGKIPFSRWAHITMQNVKERAAQRHTDTFWYDPVRMYGSCGGRGANRNRSSGPDLLLAFYAQVLCGRTDTNTHKPGQRNSHRYLPFTYIFHSSYKSHLSLLIPTQHFRLLVSLSFDKAKVSHLQSLTFTAQLSAVKPVSDSTDRTGIPLFAHCVHRQIRQRATQDVPLIAKNASEALGQRRERGSHLLTNGIWWQAWAALTAGFYWLKEHEIMAVSFCASLATGMMLNGAKAFGHAKVPSAVEQMAGAYWGEWQWTADGEEIMLETRGMHTQRPASPHTDALSARLILSLCP